MGGSIAIAGGGIGGLCLAVALQERGIDVVVFERQPEIRDMGAGISLWPNALAALDTVGLGDLVRAIGVPLAEGGERRLDGRTVFSFSATSWTAALGQALICVDRGDLVRALASSLAPGTVRGNHAVSGFGVRQSEVVIRLEGQDEFAAAALVGADGINSAIATQLCGPLASAYSGFVAWRGIAEMIHEPDRDQIWACLVRGREVGWLPASDNRTYWFATTCLPRDVVRPTDDKAYVRELLREWPSPVPELIADTPPAQLVRSDIVDRRLPSTWGNGLVTLLGDAAHPMRPHLGQGGCQAIEDAATLALCLVESVGDIASAFRRYEGLRRRRTNAIVRLSKYASLTRPPGRFTTSVDWVTAHLPTISIGPALRALQPIASYRAGNRVVRRASKSLL